MAARFGFVHDAALASERYGEFSLNVLKDKEDAIFHLEKAKGFYKDWGAMKNVELLHAQCAKLRGGGSAACANPPKFLN